jgi:peptide/nickel transport system permease protein
MGRLIARRLLLAIPLLFIVSFLSFALVAIAPGNPAADILGLSATKAQVAALDKQLGFDQPVPVQYWHWLVRALQGNLGTSYTSQEPVTSIVNTGLIVTLSLVLGAALLTAVLGVGLEHSAPFAAGRRAG